MGQIARCFYYFFMIVVVIRYKTKATARRALTFIVRIFVNDTIAIAVWTSFHVCASMKLHMSSRIRLHQGDNHSALEDRMLAPTRKRLAALRMAVLGRQRVVLSARSKAYWGTCQVVGRRTNASRLRRPATTRPTNPSSSSVSRSVVTPFGFDIRGVAKMSPHSSLSCPYI